MIQEISKSRNTIMGGALLWIMLGHSRMTFQSPLLVLLQIFGYCGVDFFLLCKKGKATDPIFSSGLSGWTSSLPLTGIFLLCRFSI